VSSRDSGGWYFANYFDIVSLLLAFVISYLVNLILTLCFFASLIVLIDSWFNN